MIARATTTALLRDLSDPANHEVWQEFDGRYRPILHALGRRLGLNDADAADAAQDALTTFVRSYRAGKYDRSRGRLSSWLIGITRHCILDVMSTRQRQQCERGMSAVESLPDEHRMTLIWDEQCRREILQRAMRRLHTDTKMNPKTIRTFELLTFHDHTPQQVASELGVSESDVYVAKHRCLTSMRSIIAELRAAYEVDT